MPSRALNRALWIAVALAIVFFGLKATDTLDRFFMGVGRLDARLESGDETLHLRWRGQIDAPMASRITEAFKANRDKAHTVVLSLSSPGGSLDHGAEVIRLLRRIGKTHRLETVVGSGSPCASMCVPVYLQGQYRTAAADARFMFHEVSFRESLSDEKTPVPEAATQRETDRMFGKYFEAAGVPPEWIRKVRAAMVGGVDVWKSGQELADERAGIVQRIVE